MMDYVRLDLGYLNQMASGNQEVMDTMVTMLKEELPLHQANLRDAIRSGHTDAIYEAAHHLKSTLHYTGHTEALRLNQLIEAAMKTGEETDQIDNLWAQLDILLTLIGHSLHEQFPDH